jgi:hypothetical protein
MTETNNMLPDWIIRQATLGSNVIVEDGLTDENRFWFLLTVCCPLIFEQYAIILHPFWLDIEAEKLITSELISKSDELENKNLQRINWTNFFRRFNYDFKLESAYKTQEIIRQQLLTNGEEPTKWPDYIGFPNEGNCETEELKMVFSRLKELYGDIEVNFYYCPLKTHKWDEEKILKGKLSELDKLIERNDLRGNPTAIFPDDKSWCLITDYDLPFTYIGGKKELIDNLTGKKEFDIYEIEPCFKEKA